MDFLAIGDTVVDEFIHLKEAEVHCDVNKEACTISMRWGDKIPFESAEVIAGVGNAANAAVSSARLGLTTGFVSNVGKDRAGDDIIATLAKEGIDTRTITAHEGIPTNHHYVLCYGAERTILIRHEAYTYRLPEHLPTPKWVYLSSVASNTEEYHDQIADWLEANPETKFAFQPGTFQIMKMGKERLARLYARADLFVVNKEESQRILGSTETDISKLLDAMRALGPKTVIITDGPNGAYAFDGTEKLRVPVYPDQKPAVSRTGAGDAMASTVTVALAIGKPLREALLWGPVNSMSVIQQVGAQKGLLTRDALIDFLAKADSSVYRVDVL